MYKISEMIFYLTDWELLVHADPILVHADPILVLTAAGKPSVSKAPQSMSVGNIKGKKAFRKL